MLVGSKWMPGFLRSPRMEQRAFRLVMTPSACRLYLHVIVIAICFHSVGKSAGYNQVEVRCSSSWSGSQSSAVAHMCVSR